MNRIIIQNDITRISIDIWENKIIVFIKGRKTGSNKRYLKSSTTNEIPLQYRDIIDNYLIMHKLTL
jgi:hypothetical protein